MSYLGGRSGRSRTETTTTFMTWLLVVLALSISPVHAEQQEEPSAIAYTPAEQRLLDAGFPTTDEHWYSKEFTAAKDAILTVAKEDPAGLPRWNEDGTGLFSRLLEELAHITTAIEEVAGESDSVEDCQEAIEYIGPFTTEIALIIWHAYCYLPDGTTMMYEREMLSMHLYVVRLFGIMTQQLTQLKQVVATAGVALEGEQHDMYQRYQAILGRVTNAMINVIINPGYRHPDLRAIIFIDCRGALINLMQVLPETDREDAIFKLDLLNKFNKNQEEREAISAIIGQDNN